MKGFLWLLLFATNNVSCAILEATFPSAEEPLYTSQYGVDLSSCSSITFQVKACHDAHVLLGNGTAAGSYEIVIGGWENTKSAFRVCSQGCYETDVVYDTPDILDCTSFRHFWLSWKDKRISFGTGNVPHISPIFEEADPNLHVIHIFGVLGFTTSFASLRLGDVNKSMYEVATVGDKYSSTPITEVTTNLPNCSSNCHKNTSCGMFSYNTAQNACALYDRTSSTTMTSQAGWKSWKMRYCWD